MTLFWLAAGLLLLIALAYLLLPIVRGRRAQTEEDRTALNVSLYQERLAELQAQYDAGTLSAEQLEAGKAEAGRELLEDTGVEERLQSNPLGRGLPLVMALLMPVLGYALYLHWGASTQVQETVEQRQNMPQSLDEMVVRLEQAVKDQPASVEAWFFLARGYMAANRLGEAASAFQRTVELSGREPDLLGLWAQALYFAADRQWNEQIQDLVDEALKANPEEQTSLGLLGIDAFENERFAEAIGYWQRVVDGLAANDPARQAIQSGIEAARARLPAAEQGEAAGATPAPVQAAQIRIEVSLDPALQDKVAADDSLFVFVRAPASGPMPLAVKRLKVADLPLSVTLSDADIMLPGQTLQGAGELQAVARISRSGNASQGEWQAVSEAAPLGEAAVRLVIDRAP